MRITEQVLPLAFLFLALPFSLVYEYTLIKVVLMMASVCVLRLALVQYMLINKSKDKRMILETISISHYVEKVRWCLDYLDLDYVEEEDVGILGVFLLGRSVPQLKVPGTGVTIGNSADILHYLYGTHCTNPTIAQFLQPTQLSLSLEKKFDQLGEEYRRFCYFTIFSNLGSLPHMQEFLLYEWGLHQPAVPLWQKYLLKPLAPVFVRLLQAVLRITPEESQKSVENANKILDEVESLLSDGRQFLLNTPHPTYIDFHLASMVAIMTNPQDYGGKIFSQESRDMVKQWRMPEEFNAEVQKIKDRVAGKFVDNIYETYRRKNVQKLD